jgi:hypothetical protein
MFTGSQIATLLKSLDISHVVTVPDSTIGRWDPDIEASGISVVRVCREGEAWSVAGGLMLGGASPFVLIQCTGLFESGDALRNTIHEWKLPIYSMVGYRSYLNQDKLPGGHLPHLHGADPRRVEAGRAVREAARAARRYRPALPRLPPGVEARRRIARRVSA